MFRKQDSRGRIVILTAKLCQMTTSADFSTNLKTVQETIRQGKGTDLIVFPEKILFADVADEKTTVPSKQEIVNGLEQLARVCYENDTHALVGTLFPTDEGLLNRAYLVGSSHQQFIDQVHTVDEQTIQSGKEIRQFTVNDTTVGCLVGFDAFFPEVARIHIIRGAQLLIMISSSSSTVDSSLLRRRAAAFSVVNQCFVIYLNHSASHFGGDSVIYSPHGHKISEFGLRPESKILQLDLKDVTRLRSYNPTISFRKPSLYQEILHNA